MSTSKSASLEARLKNNKDLLESVSQYSKYHPTSEDLKKENYSSFLDNVESAMTDFRSSYGLLSTEKKEINELFENMTDTAKRVRSEVGELKGIDSYQYGQVNSVVKLITGENVTVHNLKKKEAIKNLKEGENEPVSSSVSQRDKKTMLGNFRLLNGIIRSFTFYEPEDPTLSIESLNAMETELSNALERVAQKEASYTNHRSRIISYFNDKEGLSDRARRAKMHIKRKYGARSPEYKALVNKKY